MIEVADKVHERWYEAGAWAASTSRRHLRSFYLLMKLTHPKILPPDQQLGSFLYEGN
jgi:hypothetical protein